MADQFTDLTLKSLHLLSPQLAADFQDKMRAAVVDVKQRITLGQAREVSIKLVVKPHPEDEADVLIQPEVTAKTPSRKLEAIRCLRNNKTNQLRFEFEDSDL